MRKNKPIIIGAIGVVGLLIIYFGILSWVISLKHALEVFAGIWYWIIILAIGFGIQLGLYSYIRINIRKKAPAETAEVATAGGISTGSMIACCAHHIANILPIIGLSGLSATLAFFEKYQISFIMLGIFSNLFGITMMLNLIQKTGIYPKNNTFIKTALTRDMKVVRNIVLILSITIVGFSFLWTSL
ncbi:MAG: hypothetical protein M1371_02245 [Actinobacteria bacterium]|nr:hypothetical protein [Actinomycetota bacterium]